METYPGRPRSDPLRVCFPRQGRGPMIPTQVLSGLSSADHKGLFQLPRKYSGCVLQLE